MFIGKMISAVLIFTPQVLLNRIGDLEILVSSDEVSYYTGWMEINKKELTTYYTGYR